MLGSAGGAAGTGFLDFLQVTDDLGGTLLDRLAVGAHHKAAQTLHKGAGFLELAAHTLGLDLGAGDGASIVIAQAAIANFRNNVDGRNQAEQPHRVDLVN